MNHFLSIMAVKASLMTPLVPVNFTLSGLSPTLPGKTIQDGLAAPDDEVREGVATSPRSSTHFSIAHGFGKGVPLGFAVRQIVPRGVNVSYGSGVTPEATVDWLGGQPWNKALESAIAPYRWHAVTGRLSVRIVQD